jgi:hypothetical protein
MESDLGYLDSFIGRVFWQTVDAVFLVQLQIKKDFFHGVPAWPSGFFHPQMMWSGADEMAFVLRRKSAKFADELPLLLGLA